MSDFEVHPIGTASEIKLSRELANAVAKQIEKEDNRDAPRSHQQRS